MATKTSFEYGINRLRDLQVKSVISETSITKNSVNLTLNDEEVRPSKRFWTSLQMRFGFTPNIFKYFSHQEVFERISAKNPQDELRWCLERNSDEETPTLLAVTNPKNSTVTHDDLSEMLERYGNEEVTYSKGIVRSTHAPRHGGPFKIGGDDFSSKFVIDTPIDGFGRPSIYLSLLRQICSNGAVAFTPAFRSELNTGKGVEGATFAIARALEGFNNEEGFAALRQRFDSATRSWASVNEVQRMYKLLLKLFHNKELNSAAAPQHMKTKNGEVINEFEGLPLFRAFHKMTGDLQGIYGMSNIDALSIKRQRTLPAACRVYDLLNFASELATHHSVEGAARSIQAHIGTIVSSEYDLEGTTDQFADWKDFFIKGGKTAETKKKTKGR